MLLSEAPLNCIFGLFLKRIHKPNDQKKFTKKNDKIKTTNNFFEKNSSQNSNPETKKQQSNPSEFLSAIIHELKNPLNAIIGFSEILKQEVRDPKAVEECADYAQEINQAAIDLNDIVHDLLEVNSATLSGNFSVDLSEEIDIRNLIKRSVKLNYDYSLKKGVTLKAEITDDISTIKLDMKRMKQILTNLISNAIKYSPKKTETKISVKNIFEDNKKYLQISVTDQGFGMTEEQIHLAFQKYQTIQNPNSGTVDSFGLGLPITKQLVELQNGKIEVSSQPNQGTEMKLTFPYLM
jgi:two-component system cell cycle sensor histidine kinase PleC